MSTPEFFLRPARWQTALACSGAAVLLLTTACAAQSEEPPEPPGITGSEREVDFTVGQDEVFGTFTAPDGSEDAVPGALIISGSGPTDRDGNSEARPEANTNLNFARVLAEAGVATLRYDKLGSGETGFGEQDPEADIDPAVFDEQMAAAYEELTAQPEVDPDRIAVLGHSEGALYALRAHELVEDATPAVVLAAPIGDRYLNVIDRQFTEQAREGEAAGELEELDAVTLLSDARAARAAVRDGHDFPDELAPELEAVYSSQNRDFLAHMDGLDPAEQAANLPEDTSTLVLWGEDDTQVIGEDIDRLMTGFGDRDADLVTLPETDHVFRRSEDTPGAVALDEQRPFAEEVAPALEDFLATAW